MRSASAISVGFGGLSLFMSRRAHGVGGRTELAEGFGPLVRDAEGILDLPAGFQYRVISRRGDAMTDGLLVPGRPDGMAAFPGADGLTVLVRNHENSSDEFVESGFGEGNVLAQGLDPASFYDYGFGKQPCLGGTTTVVYDTRTGEVHRQFQSLRGTSRNCAGGPTPWGTWVSCEETVQRADGVHEKDHGWCFEVPAHDVPFVAEPRPLTAMGRFNHEAIAVDPRSGVVYLTEDQHDGLLYRYVPAVREQLHEGGRLEVLARKGVASYDTRNWGMGKPMRERSAFDVEWLPIGEIDSPNDDLRARGFAQGAARFARGEGMWYGNDAVYFACTNGGAKYKGQIWRYVPSPVEGTAEERLKPGRLQLFIEPNDGRLIENCDNVTVAPWGDLVVCEDGSGEQFIVGITPHGEIYKLAHNAMEKNSEFAGATFSPDGRTLFLNIQSEGLTLAVSGPWHTRRA